MELTNREIIKYFKDVAAAAQGVPLIHYNIPRAKNYLVGPDYRRILDAEPSLIGVKFTFAGSHFGDLQQALQLCPELSFFVAENLLVSAMMLGARGSYSSVICANPLFMQTMFDLAEAHRWDEAMAMQAQATAFFRDLFGKMQEFGLAGVDPVIDKALSVGSGFFTGHQRTRPPYIGWTDEELAKVRAWWKQAYPQLMAPPIP
jgi:dihydrodipicolinate synthase/N-acetylneuraminate lyase